MSEPTILVTGASGLLGNAVRVLLESGGRKVLPIDRTPGAVDGREVTVCDLGDVHRLHALAVENRIVGIVHCGAHSGPMVARDNPNSMVQVNIVGTANVLEIARINVQNMLFSAIERGKAAQAAWRQLVTTPASDLPSDVPAEPHSRVRTPW